MINDEIGSCDEATGGSERLAECSHLDVDLVGTVELGGKASASWPTDPVGVDSSDSLVEKIKGIRSVAIFTALAFSLTLITFIARAELGRPSGC